MTLLPILELGDDPFERGLVHGRTLASEIPTICKPTSIGLKLVV
jgi:hypothetical protein